MARFEEVRRCGFVGRCMSLKAGFENLNTLCHPLLDFSLCSGLEVQDVNSGLSAHDTITMLAAIVPHNDRFLSLWKKKPKQTLF